MTLRFFGALALVMAFMLCGPALAQDRVVPAGKGEITLSFAPVVRQVAPAVVNIYTKRTVSRRAVNPFLDDPFFQQFFGQDLGGGGLTRKQVEGALGSGVIVDSGGLVVTNAHVIKDADEITVVLGDGREFDGKIVLIDEPSDVALVRADVKGEDLPAAILKKSETLEVGDMVLAIGNPFGVGQTVTSGIVSALSRSSLDISDYNFFIQTDAAVNPGNSGGPLVAMDGTVVGINTAIYSRSGGSLGIGFAIPSEMVMAVIAAEKGDTTRAANGMGGIRRPWLGVNSQPVTRDVAESLGLKTPAGTLIAALHDASPLKKAGARVGDIIVSINGKPIRDGQEMKFRLATTPVGETVSIGVYRDGAITSFDVKTIVPPDDPPRQETKLDTGLFNGITVANINPAVAVEVPGLDAGDTGVVILRVDPRSPAGRLFRPGDIIMKVNDTPIPNVGTIKKALMARIAMWNVIFSRDGRKQQIVVR